MMNFVPQNADDLLLEVADYRTKKLAKRMHWNYKVSEITKYLDKWDIIDVVVGVSGGIDSSLVLALLAKIPGIRIHAVTIAFDQYKGIFNSEYIYELKEHFSQSKNIVWYDLDLTPSFKQMMNDIGIESGEVDHQVNYAMRYLAFFALAQHHKAIVFGTTNRDELEYAGWFGKHSDMKVDVQPIADLHKFEVVQMAEDISLPECIITRDPVGDLIDCSTDEENFGCTYDELSWFTYHMRGFGGMVPNAFLGNHFAKLIALHKKNAHKYQTDSFQPIFI